MNWMLSLCLTATTLAFPAKNQDHEISDPIIEIEAAAEDQAFIDSGAEKPLVLCSQDEASKYFNKDELAKLAGQVDFSQQFILLFAWRGSGQDKLDFSVMESFPEQIAFSYRRGFTRDLRPHVKVYALRKNVRWRVGDGKLNSAAAGAEQYLNEDGELLSPLILRDAQFGFAGETGNQWTIETDGSWQRQSFLNEQLREADLQGQLKKEQLQELAEALARADLLGLPDKSGDVGVNPHIVTVSFGEQSAAIVLTGGMPLPDEDKDDDLQEPAQRVAYIFRTLQAQLKLE